MSPHNSTWTTMAFTNGSVYYIYHYIMFDLIKANSTPMFYLLYYGFSSLIQTSKCKVEETVEENQKDVSGELENTFGGRTPLWFPKKN